MQSLKYSSYPSITIRMMLLISTLHLQESQNIYDSHTNTIILSRRLCVCLACCLCLFLSSFFVNAATTVFFSSKKYALYLKKNAILCLFLKKGSFSERVVCVILNNLLFPIIIIKYL